MAADARIKRMVMASDRKLTPPNAASSGTGSWTVAARMALSWRNAAYQMA
jgi:hypothetical protein